MVPSSNLKYCLQNSVRNFWVIRFATEDVDIPVSVLIHEMAGDERRFDQLYKTESHKVVTPKVYHNGFTKWFHIDNFTEFLGKYTDRFSRSYLFDVPALHIEDAM